MVDSKLKKIQQEVTHLADHCKALGDERTRQLLLEISEMIDLTHATFTGKTMLSVNKTMIHNKSKH